MTNKPTNALDESNIGPNLIRLGKEHNYTKEQLAELIGVSCRIIYDYEAGIKTPSLKTLIKIAKVFGVSLDSILRKM